MTPENYEHLNKIDLIPKNIEKLLVGEIYPKHLGQLWTHFEGIKANSSNKDVILAANDILAKIDNIVNLGKTKYSGEIIAATADDYNDIDYKKVA